MADPGPAFDVVSTGGYAAALSRFDDAGLSASLVLDGASVPDVQTLLDQAGLPFESLFSGPDQDILANEAPMLIALPQEDRAVVTAFLSRLADSPGAAHVLIGHRSQGPQIRRHLRKWLSVHLPRTAPERTPEDKPVLFRFYDPAILALFLGTLTLSEAAAFTGPIDAWATPGQQGRLWTLTPEAQAAAPAITGPAIFRIRPEQHVILAKQSLTTFEAALFAYLRDEFAPETAAMDDAALRKLIAQAIADGERIEDTRPGSVASLAVLHLLRPDLMADPFVWAQVMGDNPEGKDPKQRVGLLEAYHFTNLKSVEEFDAFYARLGRFWDFY